MKEKDAYNESEEKMDTLNDSFFEVLSRDEIPFYIAGVLDVSENVYDKGIEFLKEDKSFAILFDIFSALYNYVEKYCNTSITKAFCWSYIIKS